ncbi:hypothetical protein JC2156_03680 [Weissella koreensis KCTC 3621]|nr:hypothetical protein JC2156_04720 [Weissella koreensis KCTC 3621]EJF34060.1 hypothetical protein JC2156_03680 [Weissella koreensis KCTC 3621]
MKINTTVFIPNLPGAKQHFHNVFIKKTTKLCKSNENFIIKV